MSSFDNVILIDCEGLSDYINKSVSFIEKNKTNIIGSIKIGDRWLFNINLIKWLRTKCVSYLSTDGSYTPNCVKAHEQYKKEYVSVQFYIRQQCFISTINNIASALSTPSLYKACPRYLEKILDSLFHSSQNKKRSFIYDDIMLVLPSLSFNVKRINAGTRPDYFYAEVGGGPKHRNLAKIVLRHYVSYYGYKPEVEAYHGDKRVDIYDVGRGIIYEIGDTDPTGVFRHFLDDSISFVYVVPFQPHDDNYVLSIEISLKTKEKAYGNKYYRQTGRALESRVV